MSSLYSNLSEIYESMYQTFINYEEEFAFYFSIFKKYQCQSVLEAGCGTGNLAHQFLARQVDYVGMDLSENMIPARKFWKINQAQHGAFDWRSVFYEEQTNGSWKKIGEDQSTIRSFEENEMKTFLEATGFKVEEIIPQPSYAFDTLVVVAKKGKAIG